MNTYYLIQSLKQTYPTKKDCQKICTMVSCTNDLLATYNLNNENSDGGNNDHFRNRFHETLTYFHFVCFSNS